MEDITQTEVKSRLWTDSFQEHVAVIVYEAMRFERRDSTPDWQVCGNSNAQNEACAVAFALTERFRHVLRDLPGLNDGILQERERCLQIVADHTPDRPPSAIAAAIQGEDTAPAYDVTEQKGGE